MKLANRTFKRTDYKLTSKFGYRSIINTSKGATASFHCGCDYGTGGNKWPQYALESGKVTKVFTDPYGAKCVYVQYPRLGIVLFYAHLDSICVKVGQSVDSNTIIGYTGKTGKATGIHLHLGLQNIGSTKWLDPEKYDYIEGDSASSEPVKEPSINFLGSRGYLKLGDSGENIEKICKFMHNVFPAYGKALNLDNEKILGNYFGPILEAYIKEFQRRAKAEGNYNSTVDGCIGPITLASLKKYGFIE